VIATEDGGRPTFNMLLSFVWCRRRGEACRVNGVRFNSRRRQRVEKERRGVGGGGANFGRQAGENAESQIRINCDENNNDRQNMLACLPINAREALGRSSYGSGKAHGGGGNIILAVGPVLVLQLAQRTVGSLATGRPTSHRKPHHLDIVIVSTSSRPHLLKIDHDHGRNPPNSLLNALGSVCPSTPPPKIQRQQQSQHTQPIQSQRPEPKQTSTSTMADIGIR
jgi:hypothetical protein